jgi:type IV pilus assembly protein PilO
MNVRVEKILNLPGYQRFLIAVVVMALVLTGFYFTLYSSQIEEYDRLVSKRESAQAKLLKNQKIADNLEVYRAEYEKMELQLEMALEALPLEQEIPSLLTGIADLARDKGLDILRFKPAAERIQDFYAEVPVDLKLTGSYHEAAVFFDAVSRMQRIVNIQSLKMGSPKNVDGKTQISVDCQATTYRFVEQSPDQEGAKKSGGKNK